MKSKAKILVVDDNKGIRAALEMLLPRFFAQVEMLSSPKSLQSTIRELQPDVVLLDMNFQTAINTGNEGLYWLSEIKQFAPNIEVVLFTAYGDIQLAVEGMKRGAFDFIVKPWDNNKLVETLTLAYQQKLKRTGKKSPSPSPITNSPSQITNTQKNIGSGKATVSAPEGMQLSFFQLDDPVLEQIRDEVKSLDINKIPEKFRLFLKNNASKNYQNHIEPDKDLQGQVLSPKTLSINKLKVLGREGRT